MRLINKTYYIEGGHLTWNPGKNLEFDSFGQKKPGILRSFYMLSSKILI